MAFITESFTHCLEVPSQEFERSSKQESYKPKPTTKVRFQSTSEVSSHESEPLTPEEVRSQWYSIEEIKAIMIESKQIVARKEARKEAMAVTVDESELRGLESVTFVGQNRTHAKNSIRAVLKEQSRLREAGVEDPNRLQQVYHQRSAYQHRIAHLRALDDAAECNEDADEIDNTSNDSMATYNNCPSVSQPSKKRLNIVQIFRFDRSRR